LAERAQAATAARRIPDATIAEYHQAGILRILQPRRFGGMEGRFSLFSRIVEEFTYGCASSAWVYAVLAEHQWILAQYPEKAQIDVWGADPLAVAASSLAPRAAAQRTEGGWRLTGRYSFSSGCDHAQWAILGGYLGSYSLPPVAIALGRRALAVACEALAGRVSRGVTRLADSEVVQMAVGEAAAAIDVATQLLHDGRDRSTDEVSSGRRIAMAE